MEGQTMADSWKRWMGSEILLAGTEHEPPIAVVGVRARAYPHLIRGASKNRALPGADSEALECFMRAARANPRCHVSRCYCGVALIRLQRFQEAAEQLDISVRMQPLAVDYRYNRAIARACMGDVEGAMEDLDAALMMHDARWRGSNARALGFSVATREKEGGVLARRSLSRAMAASAASLPAALNTVEAMLEGEEGLDGEAGYHPRRGGAGTGQEGDDAAGTSALPPLGSVASSLGALQRSREAHAATKHFAKSDPAEYREAFGMPPVDWESLSCMPSVVSSLRKTLAPRKLPPVVKARFADDIDARLAALARGELGRTRSRAESRVVTTASRSGSRSGRPVSRGIGDGIAVPAIPSDAVGHSNTASAARAQSRSGLRGAPAWREDGSSSSSSNGGGGGGNRGGGAAASSGPSLRDVGNLDGQTLSITPYLSLSTLPDPADGLRAQADASALSLSASAPVLAGVGGLPEQRDPEDDAKSAGEVSVAASLAWGKEGVLFRRAVAAAVYQDTAPGIAPLESADVGSSLRLRRTTDLPPGVEVLRLRGMMRRRAGNFAGAFEDYAAALRIEEAEARAGGLGGSDDAGSSLGGGGDTARERLRMRGDEAAGQPVRGEEQGPGGVDGEDSDGGDEAGEGGRRRRRRRSSIGDIPEEVRAEVLGKGMVASRPQSGEKAKRQSNQDKTAAPDAGGKRRGSERSIDAMQHGSDDDDGDDDGKMRLTLPPPAVALKEVVQGTQDLYSALFGRKTDLQQAFAARPGARSPEQCLRIASALGAAALLQDLGPQVKKEIAQRVEVRQLKAGEMICSEGDEPAFLGVIITGSALVKVSRNYKQALAGSEEAAVTAGVDGPVKESGVEDKKASLPPAGSSSSSSSSEAAAATGADAIVDSSSASSSSSASAEPTADAPPASVTLEQLRPGDTVNELALLWGRRHSLSVVAETPVALAVLDSEHHFELGLDTETLRLLEDRKIMLRKTGAFDGLSGDELLQLATVCRPVLFNEGSVIIRQGSIPHHLCVLSKGIAGVFRFSDELAGVNREIRRLSEELSRANYRHRFHHNMLSEEQFTALVPVIQDDDEQAAHGDRDAEVGGALAAAKDDGDAKDDPVFGDGGLEDAMEETGGSMAASGETRMTMKPSRMAARALATTSPSQLRAFIRRHAEELERSHRAYPLRGEEPWRFTAVYRRRREMQQELLSLLRRKMRVLLAREEEAAAVADEEAQEKERRRRLRERAQGGMLPLPKPSKRAVQAEADNDGLGARVQTLFPPSLFAEQAVTDPHAGIAPGSVVAETMCKVLRLSKQHLDPSFFPKARIDAIVAKAPVCPDDRTLRAQQRQDASWESYKGQLMAQVSKRKWPVNKLMVTSLSGGRSIIRKEPPAGLMGAIVRSQTVDLPAAFDNNE